jgi:hypothetical protein
MGPSTAINFDDIDDDANTFRGRAYHARMGAAEASSDKLRAIFERLAASYEALAQEVERLEKADGTVPYDALAQTVERLESSDESAAHNE